ncbi:GNAT family N-acetyltransferase [Paucibacter sp. TC2R-5]|uniref:GNAT family N-acetyltransferase n=1 Tax=Paucibacter sp. TC2R-5 TaxID=2893555 RepID=UPI0021E4126B|nr:GNAT family N-acetyltransferase [Paucibacter sp. TC2R-5]MCV2360452.1 GNAT family N-acetyltransferase [Paucibacter sp. TC2R-5]
MPSQSWNLAMTLTELQIRRALPEDRLPLFRMLELYQHDLSDIWDQDLDSHGEYGYELDQYWRDRSHHAFVTLVNGRYAGFALVNPALKVGEPGASAHWMAQFFVLKKYRRTGLGAELARAVFSALPGQWEVGQMRDNLAAQAFWRRVIAGYTGGAFTEHVLSEGWWQGLVQCFVSAPALVAASPTDQIR